MPISHSLYIQRVHTQVTERESTAYSEVSHDRKYASKNLWGFALLKRNVFKTAYFRVVSWRRVSRTLVHIGWDYVAQWAAIR